MKRRLYNEDHLAFMEMVDRFISDQVLPHYEKWQNDKMIPRSLWEQAGSEGLLCVSATEEEGGAGADFTFSSIITERLYFHGVSGVFFPLHSDIVFPYLSELGTPTAKKQWVTSAVQGQCLLALALTEPNTGSDLAAIQTTATESSAGYVLNGSKTFISNGQTADLVVVAAKTDNSLGAKGISLFLVPTNTKGFSKGRNIPKIGLHAQDTSEMFFENCEISKDNLLGEENQGFQYLMNNLQQERLVIAVGSLGAMLGCLDLTQDYVKTRKAFKKSISDFQNTKFELAEMATLTQLSASFIDDLLPRHVNGENLVKEVSMAKYWLSEKQFEVAHRCLQLFGGYGYTDEYPISRHFVDARVQMIYGGTNEIMKELIARHLDL